MSGRTAEAAFLSECGHCAAKVRGELSEVELKAGVEGTELRELCARFIEAHLVDQLFEDERILREHGVERLVIAGLATDYCVKDTVLDARRLGFPVTVIADAIRAVDLNPGDGDRAKQAMREAGAELA